MMASDQLRNDNVSPSGSSSSFSWKKLWKLAVPPKVRAFWWRVIKNFVPYRHNLQIRHMEQIGNCKICGADEETTFHALFECSWARAFWKNMQQASGVKIPQLHPRSWATDLVDGTLVSEDHTCIILCGAWAVWSERNFVWHGDGGRTVTQSVRWAVETAVDLRQAGKEKKPKHCKVSVRWKPPDPGIVKINTDAGYNKDENNGVTGIVVRNHEGVLLRAQGIWHDHAWSATALEAEAVREGVRLAIDMGLHKLVVETDAQEVINLYNQSDTSRSIITSVC
jgi:hypothetical protein